MLLERETGLKLVKTDDYIPLGWEQAAMQAKANCERLGSFIIEGVRAEGSLRRGLEVDCLIWLRTPHVTPMKAQAILAEQVDKRIQSIISTKKLIRKPLKVIEIS